MLINQRHLHYLYYSLTVLILLTTVSCSYKKRKILFKTAVEHEKEGVPIVHIYANGDTFSGSSEQYVRKIQKNDKIVVRFLNNYDIESSQTSNGPGEPLDKAPYYVVDKSGEITLPLIGNVKVIGLSQEETSEKLKKLYSKDYKNPIVEVDILNVSINVLGEVQREGVYPLVKDEMYLHEVLALAGGITSFGKKENVKIIRGNLKNPEIIIVNMTMIEFLSSDEILVRENDIIYVEPRPGKMVADAMAPYIVYTSVLTGILTLAIIWVRTAPR
jgi:polysaccharide export outer membrane protein